jgi:LexA-binding, inner membrane-associated putative hydrolase
VHVVTHLLAGWTLAEQARLERRDRALVALAGVAPDLDGIGLPVDWVTGALGSGTAYYETYHHVAFHGLPAAALFTLACLPFLQRKAPGAALVFAAFQLHLLCDLAGSGGSTPGDIWPLHYWWPFSDSLIAWGGQWPLTSWQNTTLTALLMLYALWAGVRHGRTPLELFSLRADTRLVAALRARFSPSR